MKKILILGAGFLQSFVIKRAKELGYTVYVLDMDKNALGFKYADKFDIINIVDCEKCLQFAIENNIDGVLTAATDYGVLSASYIANKLNLPGINIDSANLIKNKYLVRKCLFENKVDDTEQAYLVDNNTDFNNLSQKIKYPVMIKPCDGSGSRGANRVDNSENFEENCKLAINSSLKKQALVETFIVGKEYGVESFVENGNYHILTIMQKKMTKPPYYAELGHSVPSGLSKEIEDRIKNIVTKALKSLNVNFGSVNMDLLISENNKIHIVDVGARMGGNLIGSHIIPLSAGIDYMGNMIKGAVGDKTDFNRTKSSNIVTRLLALTPGKVKTLPDFNEIEKKYNVKIEHHLNIGDTITPYRTNLDGCGYVISNHNDIIENTRNVDLVLKEIDNSIVRF